MFNTKSLLTLITLLLFTTASCDILEEQEPQQSLSLDQVFNSKEALNSAMVGAYNDLQDGDVAGSNWILFPSIMADNAVWNGSFVSYRNIALHQMEPSNGTVESWWEESYEVINDVNAILNAIPNVEGTKPSLKGEALFIRGITYFELVRVFAKPWGSTSDNSHMGVPVVTKPTQSSEDFTFPSRASVKKVYNQAISDLKTAVNLLPPKNADGRATKFAALAYLAKIRLQQGKYQMAADRAKQVLNGPFELNDDVLTYYREEFSNESIMEIAHTAQDNPGVNASLTTFYNPNARDDIQLSQGFLDAMDSIVTAEQEQNMNLQGLTYEDTRKTQLLTTGSGQDPKTPESGSDNTIKYEEAVNTSDNAPLLRLAEMKLTRAEALAEVNGVNQESIDLLNEIRTRAIIVRDQNGNPVSNPGDYIGYEQNDFNNAQELINKIMLERRVELAFEGQRLHDLVRRRKSVRGTAPTANELVFPIPQRELDANKNLKQNPGY